MAHDMFVRERFQRSKPSLRVLPGVAATQAEIRERHRRSHSSRLGFSATHSIQNSQRAHPAIEMASIDTHQLRGAGNISFRLS